VSSDDRPRGRRAFLTRLGQSAAVVVAGSVFADIPPRRANASPRRSRPPPVDDLGLAPGGPAAPSTTPVHDDLPPAPDAATTAFAAGLTGTSVGAWTVARVHGVFRGGLPMVLAHADGRRAQIDLLAHDAASPPGIAATGAGHLYLVNSGRGTRTTPPDLEAAIHQLARVLAHRAGDRLGLVSQAERHRRFPGGVYVVPT
jgi:hypothetical protein